jgi:hypothetical protein
VSATGLPGRAFLPSSSRSMMSSRSWSSCAEGGVIRAARRLEGRSERAPAPRAAPHHCVGARWRSCHGLAHAAGAGASASTLLRARRAYMFSTQKIPASDLAPPVQLAQE